MSNTTRPVHLLTTFQTTGKRKIVRDDSDEDAPPPATSSPMLSRRGSSPTEQGMLDHLPDKIYLKLCSQVAPRNPVYPYPHPTKRTATMLRNGATFPDACRTSRRRLQRKVALSFSALNSSHHFQAEQVAPEPLQTKTISTHLPTQTLTTSPLCLAYLRLPVDPCPRMTMTTMTYQSRRSLKLNRRPKQQVGPTERHPKALPS